MANFSRSHLSPQRKIIPKILLFCVCVQLGYCESIMAPSVHLFPFCFSCYFSVWQDRNWEGKAERERHLQISFTTCDASSIQWGMGTQTHILVQPFTRWHMCFTGCTTAQCYPNFKFWLPLLLPIILSISRNVDPVESTLLFSYGFPGHPMPKRNVSQSFTPQHTFILQRPGLTAKLKFSF